jgi:hypothetical protein
MTTHIPMSRELLADVSFGGSVLEHARRELQLALAIGPKHGPSIDEAMPECLWPENTWYWLPAEAEPEGDTYGG